MTGTWRRNVSLVILAIAILTPGFACSSTYNVYPITGTSSDDEAKELYLKVALPTVLIATESGASGSGVVFGDGWLVLTAAHVITSEAMVPDENGVPKLHRTIEAVRIIKNEGLTPFLGGADVVKINHDLDLAVLKLTQVYPYAKAKFASSDPELYQKCWVSGHPHGVNDPLVTEGRVQDLWEDGNLLYSAPTTFGNSGGPVWLKVGKEYHVTSVVQKVFVEGLGVAVNHMGLGVLPSHLREFVKEFSN